MGLVEASFNLLRVPKWKVGAAVLGFVLSFEKHSYNHIMPIVYFIMKLDRGKKILWFDKCFISSHNKKSLNGV